MDILLINTKLCGAQSDPRLPLGLGYVASVLRNDGHGVQVIDANALQLSEDHIEEAIKNRKFDVVGLTGLITQFEQVRRLSSLIKKVAGTTTVLGGGLASAAPEVVLEKTDVDIVVVGEGEKTAPELFRALTNGTALEKVRGICFKENGMMIRTEEQKRIHDVSSVPFPAWDLFPMERYFNRNLMCMPKRKISIVSSRGCPYHCTFCFHGIFGSLYRVRTVESIVKEIEWLYNRYRIRGFMFEDDTFVLDEERVYELCDVILKNGLEIFWSCNARINLVDEKLIRAMKRAGCVSIAYGVESGSQAQLDKIKKGIKVEKARRVIAMTKKAGIMVHIFMMINTPGETRQTINDSIDFCKGAGLLAEFSVLTPIPGSEIYEEALKAKSMHQTLSSLVENWGSWLNEVSINLSELSSAELVEQKSIAEREILNSYFRNNIGYIVRMLILEFRVNGFFAVLRRLMRGLRLSLRVKRKLNMREQPKVI